MRKIHDSARNKQEKFREMIIDRYNNIRIPIRITEVAVD